jgi:hypothetical protein
MCRNSYRGGALFSISFTYFFLGCLFVYILVASYLFRQSLIKTKSQLNDSEGNSFMTKRLMNFFMRKPDELDLSSILNEDKQSLVSCPINNTSSVRIFGTFDDIPVGACAFQSVSSARYNPGATKDYLGYRLPFYVTDGARVYRCTALSNAVIARLAEGWSKSLEDPLGAALRNCTMSGSELKLFEFLSAKMSLPIGQVTKSIENWLATTSTGKLAIDAIQRIHLLNDPRARRKYMLISEENEWKRALPSEPGQNAFPDVNSYKIELPPLTPRTLVAKNVRIEKNGRITTENMEVFYPKRAPYSHVALMEQIVKGKMHEFTPSQNGRSQLFLELQNDMAHRSQCIAAVTSQSEKVECSSGSSIGVSTVLVTSQNLGSQMFHYMCENLPRIGAYLEWLQKEPSVYVHAACPESAGYCLPLLELLGINRNRIVRGPPFVYAKTAIVPEGGRRHWPVGNIWGLRSLRHMVLSKHFQYDSDKCETPMGDTINIMIIKRSLTRLSPFNSKWYDKLLSDFSNDLALKISFSRLNLNFSVFDDKNSAVMRDAFKQIAEIRKADIVVGAHGAGLSWITYSQQCTHFVSFRARTNSDVFEQLGLAMGIPFHHVQFKSDYSLLFKEVKTSVGMAIIDILADRKRKVSAVFVGICIQCSREGIRRQARVFDYVLATLKSNSEPLTEEDKQRVFIINPKIQNEKGPLFCSHVEYGRIAEEYVGKLMTTRLDARLYLAIIESEDVIINSYFARFWVQADQFDAVFFVQAVENKPTLTLISENVWSQPMCADVTLDIKQIAVAYGTTAVAIVVSSFSAKATTSDGRLLAVPTEDDKHELEKYAHHSDVHGPFELFVQPETDNFRWPKSYIMLKTKDYSWRYRFILNSALVRELPSATTLGHSGKVKFVETPFGIASEISCTIPLQNLVDETTTSDAC